MIANSGFPESEQNREALEIGRLFAEKNGLPWGLGIAVGMGGSYRGMAKVPLESPLKKRVSQAFHGIREEMSQPSPEGREMMAGEVAFPRWLNNFLGTRGWYRGAKKNGLRRKDLYARPYPTR